MDSSNNEALNGSGDNNWLTVTTAINRKNESISETLAVKDRSKNGSEPIGGLSKGHLKI